MVWRDPERGAGDSPADVSYRRILSSKWLRVLIAVASIGAMTIFGTITSMATRQSKPAYLSDALISMSQFVKEGVDFCEPWPVFCLHHEECVDKYFKSDPTGLIDTDSCDDYVKDCDLFCIQCLCPETTKSMDFCQRQKASCEEPRLYVREKGEPDLQYMGCFKDLTNDQFELHLADSDTNTPEECFERCQENSAGYIYSAVSNSKRCHCSAGPPDFLSQLDNDGCSLPCEGNSDAYCGGPLNLQAYYFGTSGHIPRVIQTPPKMAVQGSSDCSYNAYNFVFYQMNHWFPACGHGEVAFGVSKGGFCCKGNCTLGMEGQTEGDEICAIAGNPSSEYPPCRNYQFFTYCTYLLGEPERTLDYGDYVVNAAITFVGAFAGIVFRVEDGVNLASSKRYWLKAAGPAVPNGKKLMVTYFDGHYEHVISTLTVEATSYNERQLELVDYSSLENDVSLTNTDRTYVFSDIGQYGAECVYIRTPMADETLQASELMWSIKVNRPVKMYLDFWGGREHYRQGAQKWPDARQWELSSNIKGTEFVTADESSFHGDGEVYERKFHGGQIINIHGAGGSCDGNCFGPPFVFICPEDVEVNMNDLMDIQIRAEGSHFKVTYNGLQVFDFIDDRIPKGAIGFQTWKSFFFAQDLQFTSLTGMPLIGVYEGYFYAQTHWRLYIDGVEKYTGQGMHESDAPTYMRFHQNIRTVGVELDLTGADSGASITVSSGALGTQSFFDEASSLVASVNRGVDTEPNCITYPYNVWHIGEDHSCGKYGNLAWKIRIEFCESRDSTQWEVQLNSEWHSGAIFLDGIEYGFGSLEAQESINIVSGIAPLNVGRHTLEVFGSQILGGDTQHNAEMDQLAYVKFRRKEENQAEFGQWHPMELATLTDFCSAPSLETFILGFKTGRYSDPDIPEIISHREGWKCKKSFEILDPDDNGHEWGDIEYNRSSWAKGQSLEMQGGVPLEITDFLKLNKDADSPEWISSAPNSGGESGKKEFDMLVGCFQDVGEEPSFPHEASLRGGEAKSEHQRHHFTTSECRSHCSGYTFFALQEAGLSCKCGNQYGPTQDERYAELPLESCTHVFHHSSFHQGSTVDPVELCTSKTPEYCLGAANVNAVYRVEYPRVFCCREFPIRTPRTGEELAEEARALGLH